MLNHPMIALMQDYQPHVPDFSMLPYEPRPAAFEQKLFGWRQSLHVGWVNCEPNGEACVDYWFLEGAVFLCRLGEEDPDLRIRVIAESRAGETIKEDFIDPSDFEGAQQKLIDLQPGSSNVLFDPVPWMNGERKKTTRFGWLTMSGVHPLGSFPEPVAYWAIGPHAYQSLLPWHMPVDLEKSCETSKHAVNCHPTGYSESKVSDLLFMPGSIVHTGRLPPFTAPMKYDMFGLSEVEDADMCWVQY